MPDILLFILAAAVASAAGVAALLLLPETARRAVGPLEAAAGAALLIMGAVYLAPEATHLHERAWLGVIAGVAMGAALHRAAARLAGARAGALSLLAGLGLHSLLDGAAFVVALAANTAFGLGSAVGLVLHDAPKALFAFILLRRAGLGLRGSAVGAMLTAAGFTALGAVSFATLAHAAPAPALGALAGLASGLLIYSGLACLMTLRRPPLPAKLIAAAAAALLVVAVGEIGHSHIHGDGSSAPAHAHAH